jgi:segregation and condensation protein B
MGRRPRPKDLDADLATLAPELRWREWMGRVEAVIFASKEPVTREILARVVGPDCNLDLVIEDIRAELRGRPYDLVAVAGGWHLRTRKQFADAIHLAMGGPRHQPLSRTENLVPTAIAYFQPITRSELSQLFGKEISRDIIGQLRGVNFIAAGPRSPQPGAPYTYVTTNLECGAPHSRFNAESILMLSLLLGTPFQLVFDDRLLRIKEVGFNARMSLP